jgi:PIN domain
MPEETDDLPSPVNHVFVDYENVHAVDPAIIGSQTMHVTLLLGAKKTTLDATVVEKLLRHAATMEMIRLTSSGRNALDFTLAYYIGRAVAADPTGRFHIVSKDKGYDPLIEHLRSRHVFARRHENFTALRSGAASKPAVATAPAAAPAAKSSARPGTPPSLESVATQVLEHLRKPTTNQPRTRNKLTSHLRSHLGKKITEAEVLQLVERLIQTGHLACDDKGRITYHLDRAFKGELS